MKRYLNRKAIDLNNNNLIELLNKPTDNRFSFCVRYI